MLLLDMQKTCASLQVDAFLLFLKNLHLEYNNEESLNRLMLVSTLSIHLKIQVHLIDIKTNEANDLTDHVSKKHYGNRPTHKRS